MGYRVWGVGFRFQGLWGLRGLGLRGFKGCGAWL